MDISSDKGFIRNVSSTLFNNDSVVAPPQTLKPWNFQHSQCKSINTEIERVFFLTQKNY